MIFSAEKWSVKNEMKSLVKVSKTLSFNTMEAPLKNAFNLYIVPVLDDEMAKRLVDIYNDIAPNGQSEEDKSRDIELLEMAQFAVANLAMFYDFDEINTSISDSGFQRIESDSFKGLYKYQEDKLRMTFRNKGLNAIDRIIYFLELHIEKYPEFENSRYFKDMKSSLVRSTAEVNDVYFINDSRLIFLRLLPLFASVAEMSLLPLIGEKAFDKISSYQESENYDEKLRLLCVKFIVYKAIRKLILTTGSITDRGLYFFSLEASGDSTVASTPGEIEQIQLLASQLEADANLALGNVNRYLRDNLPELYIGSASLDRDNDGKKTFFA